MWVTRFSASLSIRGWIDRSGVRSWLPGRDSNPRPIGYKCPDISARLGLSHHPSINNHDGCRALSRFYWLGSSTSSLCTFLPTTNPLWQASLRITIEENGISSLGFPEFTRFFIPPCDGKLQFCVGFPMTIGAEEFTLFKLCPNFFPTSGISSCGNAEVFFGRFEMVNF